MDGYSIDTFDSDAVYTMVESMIYYEACRPVLEALREFGNGNLPFSKILLGNCKGMDVPSYLRQRSEPSLGRLSRGYLIPVAPDVDKGWILSTVFPDGGFSRVNHWNACGTTPFPSLLADPPLDKKQMEAIQLALSKEIALIQGPPGTARLSPKISGITIHYHVFQYFTGTGKTFVGVLISKLLIANRHLRAPKPVLFICQTNHALDQMLENIYKFEKVAATNLISYFLPHFLYMLVIN